MPYFISIMKWLLSIWITYRVCLSLRYRSKDNILILGCNRFLSKFLLRLWFLLVSGTDAFFIYAVFWIPFPSYWCECSSLMIHNQIPLGLLWCGSLLWFRILDIKYRSFLPYRMGIWPICITLHCLCWNIPQTYWSLVPSRSSPDIWHWVCIFLFPFIWTGQWSVDSYIVLGICSISASQTGVICIHDRYSWSIRYSCKCRRLDSVCDCHILSSIRLMAYWWLVYRCRSWLLRPIAAFFFRVGWSPF